MPVVTYLDFSTLMNLTIPDDISIIQIENIIDTAIDTLDVYNAGVANLTGAAGSKTGSYTQKQWGCIINVARAVYYSFFKDLDQAQLQGMAVNTNDLLKDPNILKMVKDMAEQLRSDIPPDLPIFDVRIG
jgi:hypothetical protein